MSDEEPLPPAPHTNDGFFKAVFSQPAYAVPFFQQHLPPAVAEAVDWSTLVVEAGSFVKSSLQQVHSDLVFSVRLAGRDCLLHLLFEHQSTPDPAMPLRFLGYSTELLMRHFRKDGLPLPLVFPFVIHQGPDPWNAPTTLEGLTDLPEDLREALLPYQPQLKHGLLDLTQYEPDKEESHPTLRAVLQLMKLARQKELLRFFRWLAGIPGPLVPEDLLSLMLLYALYVDSELDVEQIYPTLSDNPELKQTAMSVAEKLISKGRMEGEQIGIQKGEQIGRIRATEELLGLPLSSTATLASLAPGELEARYAELMRASAKVFKR